jgi:hypothetical protein
MRRYHTWTCTVFRDQLPPRREPGREEPWTMEGWLAYREELAREALRYSRKPQEGAQLARHGQRQPPAGSKAKRRRWWCFWRPKA